MVSIAQIEQQFKQWLSPIRLLLVRGEIRQLPRHLWEDEEIESAVQGWYKGGVVLLVATNRRLILVDHKWLDTKVDDYPYQRISSVEHDASIFMGKIIVSTFGGELVVYRIDANNLRHFCRVITEHITREQQQLTATPSVQLDNLQVLALMLDKGMMTNEEFRQQWQKLLGSSNGRKSDFLDFDLPPQS